MLYFIHMLYVILCYVIHCIYVTCYVILLYLCLHLRVSHLDFGSDIDRAALRPPPDVRLPLWRTRWAAGFSEHGAGRQLGVRHRVFGEAQRAGLCRTGLSLYRQDSRRENRDWKGNKKSLLCVFFTSH